MNKERTKIDCQRSTQQRQFKKIKKKTTNGLN